MFWGWTNTHTDGVKTWQQNEMRTKFNVVAIRWRIIIISFLRVDVLPACVWHAEFWRRERKKKHLPADWSLNVYIQNTQRRRRRKAGRGGGHLSQWRMNVFMRAIFASNDRLLKQQQQHKKKTSWKKNNNEQQNPPEYLTPFFWGVRYSFGLAHF